MVTMCLLAVLMLLTVLSLIPAFACGVISVGKRWWPSFSKRTRVQNETRAWMVSLRGDLRRYVGSVTWMGTTLIMESVHVGAKTGVPEFFALDARADAGW